jgi:DNA-binding transcriptional regulator YhcF (GntR family)
MEQVALAFRVLGVLANLNGRRLQKAYEMSRAKRVEVHVGSPMLIAKTAPRALRRRVAKEADIKFRPIYGFVGGGADVAVDHQEVIAVLKCRPFTKSTRNKRKG